MDEFKDWRGTLIAVGSTVVYATTSGRSPVMKEGIVEVISEKTDYRWDYIGEQGSRKRERVEFTYKQIGIRYTENARWSNSPWDSSRLRYPLIKNITVVPAREE